MKKKYFGVFLFLMLNCIIFSVDALWINQVYYDPLGSETYGEALELYNPSNQSIDISNWIIWTTSSETDVIIPKNTFVEPYGYFLIADTKWNESKDNTTWRNADLEDKMTLKNTNGGVAIKDCEGNIIDAVGWGDEEEIPDELFEGTPAKKVKSGKTLLRIENTDDNSKDFIASNAYFFTNGEIIITADIGEENSYSSDLQILEDDDINAEGIQIIPAKGGERKIKVKAFSPGLVMFNGRTHNLTRTNNSYEATLKIPYSLEPGKYTIKAGKESTEIEILPVQGFNVNKRSLDLNVVPGSYETKKIKLNNIGNIDLIIYAKCKKMSSEENELKGQINIYGKKLSEEWQELTTLRSGESFDFEISVSAYEDAEKGAYKSILSLKGE